MASLLSCYQTNAQWITFLSEGAFWFYGQTKNTKNAFFSAVLELMSDNLTAIYVEPHQCPLYQSILLTQVPICEIFAKMFFRIGDFEKLSFFESAILILIFWFFCFILMKISWFLYHKHRYYSRRLLMERNMARNLARKYVKIVFIIKNSLDCPNTKGGVLYLVFLS